MCRRAPTCPRLDFREGSQALQGPWGSLFLKRACSRNFTVTHLPQRNKQDTPGRVHPRDLVGARLPMGAASMPSASSAQGVDVAFRA